MIEALNSAFSEKTDDKARRKDTFQKVNFMIDLTDYEDILQINSKIDQK